MFYFFKNIINCLFPKNKYHNAREYRLNGNRKCSHKPFLGDYFQHRQDRLVSMVVESRRNSGGIKEYYITVTKLLNTHYLCIPNSLL